MLNVSYKNRIGYYTYTETYQGEAPRKFKIWICHANCLWADIYFYKNQEKKSMVQLHCFWANIDHLKRGLKDAYPEANNFHFFSDQLGTDEWKAIKILAQAGKTITIETKKHQ